MKILSSKYYKGIYSEKEIIDLNLPEFVFSGRSNVGKSTLINCLCKSKNLAKTSSFPGKTQSINYYLINDNIFFVDLPGYGYAKASILEREKWKSLIENYFRKTKNLNLIFLLIDIRHGILSTDKLMIDWINHYEFPFIIILTKSDKLSRNEIFNTKQKIQKQLAGIHSLKEILPVSGINEYGISEILKTF
jgi:GTP-binding protein